MYSVVLITLRMCICHNFFTEIVKVSGMNFQKREMLKKKKKKIQ